MSEGVFVSRLRFAGTEFPVNLNASANDLVCEFVGFHGRRLAPGQGFVNRRAAMNAEKMRGRVFSASVASLRLKG